MGAFNQVINTKGRVAQVISENSENKPTCYLVIPCYNEQAVLPESASVILEKLDFLIMSGDVSDGSRALFVDDGSKDATWKIISELTDSDNHAAGLKLSRNKGHQNALLAGLMTARQHCDIAISMDADLQDDIESLPSFIEKYKAGCQVVYGVRNNRDTDTGFKRTTASCFYKVMRIMGADTVDNHADYRLLSRQALDALSSYREVNLFLRGIVPELGFETGIVHYSRRDRLAGESKYPLRKMIAFAIDGITSFSVEPLRMVSNLGIIISIGSIGGLIYALIAKSIGVAVSGWTAIICSIWLLGGIQMLCIGVLGTYIGKIYSEVKDRPRYIIEQCILN